MDVAVRHMPRAWLRRVATVGFSMGASIVLRHAALIGGVDAVISVSGPGWWYYRGTQTMRRVHWRSSTRPGRLVSRTFLNTRISRGRWDPVPMPPDEAAAMIAPVPLLIIHGDRDEYFPVQHARRLFEAAGEPKELWIVPGFGHAESSASPALIERIGSWARTAVSVAASPNAVA